LRRLRFADRVENLPGALNARVAEGGSNISVGERQILCLARALLLRAKIVVLDEATASVDVETDRRLHQVLQEVLDDCTVMIIAHRLGTVSHCDALIEMAQGKVVSKIDRTRAGAVAQAIVH
jgi:ABC-type multidrug transport system fused ATPase/permease subunit